MSYIYKVKIEAKGGIGEDGQSPDHTNSSGGSGTIITSEYEILPSAISKSNPTTTSGTDSVWKINFRYIHGGDGGVNTTYSDEKGGEGGDGVEVMFGTLIVLIAGGGGGGAGDDNATGFAGGNAHGSTGITLDNYYRITGGAGSGEATQNGGGGGNGGGGIGGYGVGDQSMVNGTAGVDGTVTGGQGGEGGAGAGINGVGIEGCGGGGGGGGYGGGGGGASGYGIAGGGGGGASIYFNTTSDILVGIKHLSGTGTVVANTTDRDPSIRFTSYESSDGVTWTEKRTHRADTYDLADTYEGLSLEISLTNYIQLKTDTFYATNPAEVDILSDQTVNWIFFTTEFDGDELYNVDNNGSFTTMVDRSTIPTTYTTVDIFSTDGIKRGTVRYTEWGSLSFTGFGLDNDNVSSDFQVYLKRVGSTGNGTPTPLITVNQSKRLYSHTSKTFGTISNTGFKTPSNVDIATLFQPKSLLNFGNPTDANIGKFFNSSSEDFSDIFGEYDSTYSGYSKIGTDTGYQIDGNDIRNIYAKKKTSLDIFDTTPSGNKTYSFTLPQEEQALLICVGGGGAGNHGSQGGEGGHGGKIIIRDIILPTGEYSITVRVGAGENINSSVPVNRRGNDSSIVINSTHYYAVSSSYTVTNPYSTATSTLNSLINANNGGVRSYENDAFKFNRDYESNPYKNARDGGFQLKYGGNTYNIGGGGGAGGDTTVYDVRLGLENGIGIGYYGGQNGYNNSNIPSTKNSNYGGGGGGGFKNSQTTTNGGSGGDGLCAILFKQPP